MNNENKNEKNIIFGLSAGHELAKKISGRLNITMGEVKKSIFADGETLINSTISVRNKDVIVIQSTCKRGNLSINDTIMELLLFIDSLKRANAKSINVVIPFYGYSRQDRKCKPREPISAKLIANLLVKAGTNRLTSLDLHSSQIQGFFDIPVDDLPPNPLFVQYIKNKYESNLDEIVIVAPDQGAAKKCVSISKSLGVPFAIIDKDRIANNEVKIIGFMGDVENKIAIIIDDIIDTGGTISKGAKILKEKGKCKKAIIMASHGLFNGSVASYLNKDYIDEIVVTDSIPDCNEKGINNLKIVETDYFLSNVIYAWINGKSVGEVYNSYLLGKL